MEDLNTIYYNNFGIAFQWKPAATNDYKKVQLVFRYTGLLLSMKELKGFSNSVNQTLENCTLCEDCKADETKRPLLVASPSEIVSFAMSYIEVEQIKDLLDGTIFHLNLDNMLDELI